MTDLDMPLRGRPAQQRRRAGASVVLGALQVDPQIAGQRRVLPPVSEVVRQLRLLRLEGQDQDVWAESACVLHTRASQPSA